MKEKNIRKLTIAGVLVAVAVVGSLFSIPVFGAKCSPVQHMVNVLGAVLLGPGYAVGMAFAAALIRNLLGLGSLLAFPGSMIGALLCGVASKYDNQLKYIDEIIGKKEGQTYAALNVLMLPDQTLFITVEADASFTGNVYKVGPQEVRVGYEYILKTSEFELTGLICALEVTNG